MLTYILSTYSTLRVRIKNFIGSTSARMLVKAAPVRHYYRLNDLAWQDGLLIDFLQKKVLDGWTRGFLVYSSYLFSERVLFKFTVRFYVDSVVWPFTTYAPLEFGSVASLLSFTLLALSLLYLTLNVNYLYVTML